MNYLLALCGALTFATVCLASGGYGGGHGGGYGGGYVGAAYPGGFYDGTNKQILNGFHKNNHYGTHNAHVGDYYKDKGHYNDRNYNKYYHDKYNNIGHGSQYQNKYAADFYGKHKNNNYVKGKAWGHSDVYYGDEKRYGFNHAPIIFFPW